MFDDIHHVLVIFAQFIKNFVELKNSKVNFEFEKKKQKRNVEIIFEFLKGKMVPDG